MLNVDVVLDESYDEAKAEFVADKIYQLELEHSLVSLSKWEQVHEKPFLSDEPKTHEETMSYLRMMSLSGDIPEEILQKLSQHNFNQISDYINAKQSATWFREDSNRPQIRRETITSEIIYYWMLSLNIDMECQYWHLNRLMTLIRVTNEKNQPGKKMSSADVAARNRELNAKRRAQYNTRG